MAKVLPKRPSQDSIDPDALGRSNTNQDITLNLQASFDAAQRAYGGVPEKVVEIVNGDLTVDQYSIKVEAQGFTESDEINTITPLLINTDSGNGFAILEGNYVELSSEKAITIKHSTTENGVQTLSGLDVVLSKVPLRIYRTANGWVMNEFAQATDDQLINLTPEQLELMSINARQHNEKADKTSIGYKCIYGTGQAPIGDPNAIEDDNLGNNGTISYSTSYELTNPFGADTPVITVAEIYVNNRWSAVEPQSYIASSVRQGRGTTSFFVENIGIVVRTGVDGVFFDSTTTLSAHESFGAVGSLASAPCRIHVWKIGV